jgi:hypothetical protein
VIRWLRIAVCLALAGIYCLGAQDRSLAFYQSRDSNYNISVSGGGGGRTCSDGAHSAAFLARTSGLSNSQKDAYCVLINGLDTDSTFSTIDAFYVFTAPDSTTAGLNLISSSFPITVNGTVTFTTLSDYQGDGSTGWLSTAYIPSTAGGSCTQNSCGILAYVLNSRSTTTASYCEIGVANSGDENSYDFIAPDNNTSGFQGEVNGNAGITVAGQTNAQGQWVISRTGSTTLNAYKNSSATSIGSDATASTALPTGIVRGLACSFSAGAASNFSADNVAVLGIGGGWTGAQAASIMARINTYETTYGKNVY